MQSFRRSSRGSSRGEGVPRQSVDSVGGAATPTATLPPGAHVLGTKSGPRNSGATDAGIGAPNVPGLLGTNNSGATPGGPRQPAEERVRVQMRQLRSLSIDRHGAEHGPWRRSSAPAAGTVHLEAFADGPKLAQAYFNILLFGVRRMVTYPNSGGSEADLGAVAAHSSGCDAATAHSSTTKDSHANAGIDSKVSVPAGAQQTTSGLISDDVRSGRESTMPGRSGAASRACSSSIPRDGFEE